MIQLIFKTIFHSNCGFVFEFEFDFDVDLVWVLLMNAQSTSSVA